METFPTIYQIRTEITTRLSELYELPEAEAISQLWLEHVLQMDRMRLSMNRQQILTSDQMDRLQVGMKRLMAHEPIQHIIGYAYFYGRAFSVNSSVLIPRPETEELTQKIIQIIQAKYTSKDPLRILDIGTGSGCIPITLELELRGLGFEVEIHSWDISAEALAVAKQNAEQLGAKAHFHLQDVLAKPAITSQEWNLIVSNPPYVPNQEKELMRENVLAFEPDLALFVPNNDPLKFYKAIATYGKESLIKGGDLCLEIHEDYGVEMVGLLEELGYNRVEILKDFRGKDRVVLGIDPKKSFFTSSDDTP